CKTWDRTRRLRWSCSTTRLTLRNALQRPSTRALSTSATSAGVRGACSRRPRSRPSPSSCSKHARGGGAADARVLRAHRARGRARADRRDSAGRRGGREDRRGRGVRPGRPGAPRPSWADRPHRLDVPPEGALEAKLRLGRPLRVKLGIAVTSPDIHVGRGIPLQRMRAFQNEGHKAVFIVGDYTTRIGDPSGRSSERPILSDEEIDANAQVYLEQAKTILRDDPDLLEVRYNGEWLSKLSYADVVRLGRIV